MYEIVVPQQFLSRAGKFFKKHPNLKPKFTKVVQDLMEDPFQPHLELHALSGRFEGLYAISLTYAYRVTLTIMIDEKEITLIDIGGHEVYR